MMFFDGKKKIDAQNKEAARDELAALEKSFNEIDPEELGIEDELDEELVLEGEGLNVSGPLAPGNSPLDSLTGPASKEEPKAKESSLGHPSSESSLESPTRHSDDLNAERLNKGSGIIGH